MTTHDTNPRDAGTGTVEAPGPRFDRVAVRGDPIGWYVDPRDRTQRRLWDGQDWATDGAGAPLCRRREPSEPLPRDLRLWLLLGSVLPLVASMLLPIPVMNLTQPPGGVGPLDAWQRSLWSGVLVGLVLWTVGVVVWRRVESREAPRLARSYDEAARWHRTCLVLSILTFIVGLLGTFGSLVLLALAAALSSMNAGL